MKRAKAIETGSKATTNASFKKGEKGKKEDQMFDRQIVNMAFIIEYDSIVERRRLELYQELEQQYEDENSNRSSIGYRFTNENNEMYYGGSNEPSHGTLGTYRILNHCRNIETVLNGDEVLLNDRPLYNKVAARINKTNYPNGFHIDVLNGLKIDSMIFESCIYQSMKSRANYIERHRHLMNKRCKLVPIKALRILDTDEKEITSGNYFAECLNRISKENEHCK